MKPITKEQIATWIATWIAKDNFDHVLYILHQVVNGKLNVETLKSDILKSDILNSTDKPIEDFEEYVFNPNKIAQQASIWREIGDTFVDDNILFIDAWDYDEGKVIAKIDRVTGKVCYLDERARTDNNADSIIGDNVAQILQDLKDELDRTMDRCRDNNY